MSLLKLTTAFVAGTAATAWIVSLLSRLPVPRYVKTVLYIVVPLPTILVALVMLCYGPDSIRPSVAVPSTKHELAKMFLIGGLAALGYMCARYVWRRFIDGEDERNDEDEE